MIAADVLVIGGGSAGAVLANRLSADPGTRVVLVEAGPDDRHPAIGVPLGVMWLAKSPAANWLYASTPQAGLDGRRVSVPRGKVLGGSSAINGMIYIRGHRADYDAWAAMGCTGWGWDDVLPYFRRSEANDDPALDDAWHGRGGDLPVTRLKRPNPMDRVFLDAAGTLQFRETADLNTPEPEGVGIYQVTQKDGRRMSTAAAFLPPAVRRRANLRILTGHRALRLTFAGRRATGAELAAPGGGGRVTVAAGETILAAGAIGSPEILLRSGVGPAAALRAAGIAPLEDLPGVGANLHDHVDVMVIAETATRTAYGLSIPALPARAWDVLHYLIARGGMFASNMVEAGGFVRSSPAADRPDLQFHFIPGRKSHRGRMIEWGHGVALHTCLLRPRSRGSVTLDPARPDGPPRIDLGLLADPADADLLRRGVRIARAILAAPPFRPHGLREILPGAGVQDDAGLDAFIRAQARTVYHPVGTCAMLSVTTPDLRVSGLGALRVADASVMPAIVSGNTNAPVIMIAEKAADMIRAAVTA